MNPRYDGIVHYNSTLQSINSNNKQYTTVYCRKFIDKDKGMCTTCDKCTDPSY